MAATELTVRKITGGLSGTTYSGYLVASLDAANTDGNYFTVGRADAMFFELANASGGAITVTFNRILSSSHNHTVDPAVSVADGTTRYFPIDSSFKDSNGRCNVTYSGVSSVTVAVYEIQDQAVNLA